MVEQLKNLVEQQRYVDYWYNSFPEDIENWSLRLELVDHVNEKLYRAWVKYIETPDADVITNGYIQVINNEEF